MDALFELLREALALKGGQQTALAKALGVTRSRVSELLKLANLPPSQRRRGEKIYGLDTVACLRLIRLTRRPDPLLELRKLGKRQATVAAELEALFPNSGQQLTRSEQELREDLSLLKPTEYEHVRAVIKMLADGKRKGR